MNETSTQPKVFVTQYSKNLKFGDAEQFGEVVFLTDEEYKPEPSMPGHNERITQEIKSRLSTYIPGIDYIVLTGSSIPNMIVGGIIMGYAINGGLVKHNILKWSGRDKRYEQFKIK